MLLILKAVLPFVSLQTRLDHRFSLPGKLFQQLCCSTYRYVNIGARCPLEVSPTPERLGAILQSHFDAGLSQDPCLSIAEWHEVSKAHTIRMLAGEFTSDFR